MALVHLAVEPRARLKRTQAWPKGRRRSASVPFPPPLPRGPDGTPGVTDETQRGIGGARCRHRSSLGPPRRLRPPQSLRPPGTRGPPCPPRRQEHEPVAPAAALRADVDSRGVGRTATRTKAMVPVPAESQAAAQKTWTRDPFGTRRPRFSGAFTSRRTLRGLHCTKGLGHSRPRPSPLAPGPPTSAGPAFLPGAEPGAPWPRDPRPLRGRILDSPDLPTARRLGPPWLATPGPHRSRARHPSPRNEGPGRGERGVLAQNPSLQNSRWGHHETVPYPRHTLKAQFNNP